MRQERAKKAEEPSSKKSMKVRLIICLTGITLEPLEVFARITILVIKRSSAAQKKIPAGIHRYCVN